MTRTPGDLNALQEGHTGTVDLTLTCDTNTAFSYALAVSDPNVASISEGATLDFSLLSNAPTTLNFSIHGRNLGRTTVTFSNANSSLSSFPISEYPLAVIREPSDLDLVFIIVLGIMIVLYNIGFGCKVQLSEIKDILKKPIAPAIGCLCQFAIMAPVSKWHQLMRCHWDVIDWNENVVILMKFSLLAAPEVVKMTTSGVTSDENFVKMTFPFQCRHNNRFVLIVDAICALQNNTLVYTLSSSVFIVIWHLNIFAVTSSISIMTMCMKNTLPKPKTELSGDLKSISDDVPCNRVRLTLMDINTHQYMSCKFNTSNFTDRLHAHEWKYQISTLWILWMEKPPKRWFLYTESM